MNILIPKIWVFHREPPQKLQFFFEKSRNDFDKIVLIYEDHFPKQFCIGGKGKVVPVLN
jgi:hypothetical protein